MHLPHPLAPGDQVTRELPAVTINFFAPGAPANTRHVELIPKRIARLTVTQASKRK